MLQVVPMSSSFPDNWKRPWTEDNERPPITLPEPTRTVQTSSRQTSEPVTQDFDIQRRDSLPSLKRSASSSQNVDPEDRGLRAMPKSSYTDPYTKYLLSQDSPENSAKKMRMASNPWLDLKGKGFDGQRMRNETQREDAGIGTATTWTPMPLEAARPRDLTSLYSAQYSTNTEACIGCDRAAYIAPILAKGLQKLHAQLRSVAAEGRDKSEQVLDSESIDRPIPVTVLGALDMSMEKLNDNMKVVKQMMSKLNLAEDTSPTLSIPLEDGRYTRRESHASTSISDDSRSELGRAGSRDPFSHMVHSRESPTRQLPSPNALKISNAALSGVSSRGLSVNPSTTHYQDLQHQLNTKASAHQALHAEHERLLTAYSRIQTKCAALEKKQSSADSELANCIEDRAFLQTQVESLEQQVSELQISRDEAQKQSAANGSQYMQIMSMSSKLQAQGAADLKRYKVDRETWASEKEELEAKVRLLEKAKGTASIFAATLAASSKSVEEQNAADEIELATMSFDKLKEEIMNLRKHVREASTVILTMRDEGTTITRLTSELSAASERLIRLGVVPTTSDEASEP